MTQSASPTVSSAPTCAASTFAASVRASCARSYDLDGNLIPSDKNNRVVRCAWRQGLLHGAPRARVPNEFQLRSLGIRPSAFVDVGSLFSLTHPPLDDIGIFCTPEHRRYGRIEIDQAPGRTAQ